MAERRNGSGNENNGGPNTVAVVAIVVIVLIVIVGIFMYYGGYGKRPAVGPQSSLNLDTTPSNPVPAPRTNNP